MLFFTNSLEPGAAELSNALQDTLWTRNENPSGYHNHSRFPKLRSMPSNNQVQSQIYKKQKKNATPSSETPLTCIMAESLVPSAVLPTLGFVAVGFPVVVEDGDCIDAEISETTGTP
jgi:hypothetical protein